MSIGNELSYDVAAAVLSLKNENPARTKELMNVLVNFHTALQPLIKESRQRRLEEVMNNMQTGNLISSASTSFGN